MREAHWQAVDSSGTIFRAMYAADMGSPYCSIVRLASNSFLVYSPGRGLIESAMDMLNESSEILLLAPARGHTVGLESWRTHFANSHVYAADGAALRLYKKTSLVEVRNLDTLRDKLPAHVQLHQPPENSLAEVWLSIESGDKVYWLVCDSFMNLKEITGSFLVRVVMKLYGLKPGLRAHSVFRRGVKNKQAFREWAIECFANGRNNVLIPCHGEIYDAPDFTQRILSIINNQYRPE